jgi:hypothetical protein
MRTLTFTCASCDATVVDSPVFHLGLAFCCAGCAADGPCMCSYDAPGAEHATADGTLIVVGDLERDREVAAAAIQAAVIEPPALSAPTIAPSPTIVPAPAQPAAPAHARASEPAAPRSEAGTLVSARRA